MEQQMSAFVAGTCLIMSLPAALCVTCACMSVCLCLCVCVRACCVCLIASLNVCITLKFILDVFYKLTHHTWSFVKTLLSSACFCCVGDMKIFLQWGVKFFNFSHINLYKSSWYLVSTTDLWKSTDICSCNIQFVVATFYEKKKNLGYLMT